MIQTTHFGTLPDGKDGGSPPSFQLPWHDRDVRPFPPGETAGDFRHTTVYAFSTR